MLKIQRGRGMASKYGFPTANVTTDHDEHSGIFIGKVQLNANDANDKYDALIYTSDRNRRLTECHLIGFSEDIYDKHISFTKCFKIRDDVHYNTLDETIYHIHIDKLVTHLCLKILKDIKNCKRISVSFSGGKEACILIKLLDILEINYDVTHFKHVREKISDFVIQYKKSIDVKVYENNIKDAVMTLDDEYDVSILGVRRSDLKDLPDKYPNTWLKQCKLLTPLYELTYRQVWDIIDHLEVKVSDLYAKGYTSVGYDSKPNELLKVIGTNEYLHAKTLKCFDFERK